MAIPSTRYLAMAMLITIIGTSLIGDKLSVSGEDCGDISGLVKACWPFVIKFGPRIHPSSKCCRMLNRIKIPCACKLVTKEVEALVSVKKAMYVARKCGIQVYPGMKCGSYTVPAKA